MRRLIVSTDSHIYCIIIVMIVDLIEIYLPENVLIVHVWPRDSDPLFHDLDKGVWKAKQEAQNLGIFFCTMISDSNCMNVVPKSMLFDCMKHL